MKRFKYLLAVITICLLASCGNSSSMQGYVTEKMAEYSRTCVKFNRLTTSEDILDLSKCHPLAYYRTLTPPNVYGDIRECVAIKYKEGVLSLAKLSIIIISISGFPFCMRYREAGRCISGTMRC